MAQEQKADWELRQARTFEKWASIYLKRSGYTPIGDGLEGGPIDKCFQSGVNLINLLDALYKGSEFAQKKPKHKKNPKNQLQRLDNINQGITMYDKIGIAGKGGRMFTREQIEQGTWNMTLGMMWCIILHANLKLVQEGNTSGKQGLLMWCQKQCKGYNGIDGKPKNFTRNWKDGRVFNALLHRYYPDRVNFDELDPANAADNVEHAFKNFEELGIDRLIEVEDMLVDSPDEKQVMTYVSELFKFLSKQDFKQNAKDHLNRLIQFLRRIRGSCDQYEAGAQEYLEHVKAQTAEWEGKSLAESKGAAQQDIEDYKCYVKDMQPSFAVKKIDLETLYANVQTELSAKGMLPWECPDGFDPEVLEKEGARLNAAQAAYFDKIRTHRFTFIEVQDNKIDEKVKQEIEVAFERFDEDSSGFIEREEFFAAMTSIGVAIPENQQEATFSSIAGADDKISKEEYTRYMLSFFDTSDSVDGILTSCSKAGGGDAAKYDFAAAGITGEELEFINSACGDGNFEDFIKSRFK